MLDSTDNEITQLNIRLAEHIRRFLPLEDKGEIAISFDSPGLAIPPSGPTLYLYLYMLHEDLELRHNKERCFLPGEQHDSPENSPIRCLYQATYWDNESCAATERQTARYLNCVIKALLNMRTCADFSAVTVRVMEPESLNSLGHFWQASGSGPRNVIHFSVTLPVGYVQHAVTNAQ